MDEMNRGYAMPEESNMTSQWSSGVQDRPGLIMYDGKMYKILA